ncbi:MAG: hypothetical protein GF331_03980, partial [Chitinivibrionales bacterium]|nr:hypothetical protein [Chitinivibrionales bacterium]
MGYRMYHIPHICAALLCAVALTLGATVNLDESVRYQTMDGFGAAIANWLIPHNNNQAYCNQLIDDLGLSIMRIMMVPGIEQQNDNSDPFVEGNFDMTQVATQREVLEKLYTAGLRQVCLSTFTPPAWMKTNNSLTDGGELRTDMYDEFAEWYCKYIRFVESTGLEVIAISPQNEPSFALWYESCVYSPEQMRDIVKTLGQRFETEGIDTRIFWAEECFDQPWQPYAGYVFADPVAKQYGDIVAIHHQNFYDEDPWAGKYRQARDLIENAGETPYCRGFWNSEMSNYAAGWSGALQMSQGFTISLRDGRMSGLLYGSPSIVSSQPLEALMVEYEPTERYYIAKQYYRYIRPGAVMIGATVDDPEVMTVAFVHSENQTLTVVMTNRGSSGKDVTLTGADGVTFTQIRTSQSENAVTVGTVSGSCHLPAGSVTTLYAEGHISSVRTYAAGLRVAPPRAAPQRIIDLRGRAVNVVGAARRELAPGCFITAYPHTPVSSMTLTDTR